MIWQVLIFSLIYSADSVTNKKCNCNWKQHIQLFTLILNHCCNLCPVFPALAKDLISGFKGKSGEKAWRGIRLQYIPAWPSSEWKSMVGKKVGAAKRQVWILGRHGGMAMLCVGASWCWQTSLPALPPKCHRKLSSQNFVNYVQLYT